jgi:hypothetical protein
MSRVIEWLRATRNKVALVTNYRQWRLVYAGIDHDAWAEWDTALWFPEGKPGLQLDALRISSPRFPDNRHRKDALSALLEAIDATRRGQAELSSSLGSACGRPWSSSSRARAMPWTASMPGPKT